ncbi:hypothetical protein MIS45_03485 [Wielerella bovis]|uniref:hypothetical protein n=1 Tax=Wielerella bovis TaxID=2917790 RepID=UPI002018B373|nr:hypothetical protein [Wielerella bovis]ULJ69909.1 hypothetical protein MIS45_03485 [Wielerella bovis]
MLISLVLSKFPDSKDIQNTLKHLGYIVEIENNDWENPNIKQADVLFEFYPSKDDIEWVCILDIYIQNKIQITPEKLFYFDCVKNIAKKLACDVVCCCTDNAVVENIENNPYLDFAYINPTWFLVDDRGVKYIDEPPNNPLKIIRSIQQEMEDYLKSYYYKVNSI